MSNVPDVKEELAMIKRIIKDTLGERVLASLEAVVRRELDKRKAVEGA